MRKLPLSIMSIAFYEYLPSEKKSMCMSEPIRCCDILENGTLVRLQNNSCPIINKM